MLMRVSERHSRGYWWRTGLMMIPVGWLFAVLVLGIPLY